MLVVDRYTLIAVHLLNFFNDVGLSFANALDLHDFFWIKRTISDGLSGGDFLSVFDNRSATSGQQHQVLFASIVNNVHGNTLAVVFADAYNTSGSCQTC